MIESVNRIDHVALTVSDLDASVRFYVDLLGGKEGRNYEIDGQIAVQQVRIGGALVNLHRQGHSHPLVAARPTPGSGDLCFGWNAPIDAATEFLNRAGIPIDGGPIATIGADGAPSLSIYFRDPDGNLLEFLSSSTSERTLG